jgi:hypothetical protein
MMPPRGWACPFGWSALLLLLLLLPLPNTAQPPIPAPTCPALLRQVSTSCCPDAAACPGGVPSQCSMLCALAADDFARQCSATGGTVAAGAVDASTWAAVQPLVNLCSQAVGGTIGSAISPVVPRCFIASFEIAATGPMYTSASGRGMIFVNNGVTYLNIQQITARVPMMTLPTVLVGVFPLVETLTVFWLWFAYVARVFLSRK